MNKRELGKDNAIRYGKPDFEILAKLITAMRGTRSVEEYAVVSGVTPNTLWTILRLNRKAPVHSAIIVKLYNHKDNDCNVTLDELFLADGLLPPNAVKNSTIEKDKKSLLSKVSEMPKLHEPKRSGRPAKDAKNADHELDDDKIIKFQHPETISYKQFKYDLAVYGMCLSQPDYYTLIEKREDLFKDKDFVATLHTYSVSHMNLGSKERKAWTRFINGEGSLDDCDLTAQKTKQLLDNMFSFTSRAGTMLLHGEMN